MAFDFTNPLILPGRRQQGSAPEGTIWLGESPAAAPSGGAGGEDPYQRKGMSTKELDLVKKSIGPGGSYTAAQGPTYGGTDLTEKHRLEFARAKDRAGKIGAASLRGLRESMAGRGLLGSGIEAAGSADLQGDIAGNLSDVVTRQAIEGAGAATHAANQNFAAQRELTSRQDQAGAFNAQAQRQMQQSLLGLISSRGGLWNPDDPDPYAPTAPASPYGNMIGWPQNSPGRGRY